MRTTKKSRLLAAASFVGVMGVLYGSNDALGDATWKNAGTALETGSNWSTASVPTGAIANFDGTGNLNPIANAGISVLGITIANSNAASYSFGRGTGAQAMTIGTSGLTVTGSGNVTWNPLSTVINGTQTWDIGNGINFINGANNAFGFNGTLIKTGNGTLLLNTASTNNGGVSVSAGTLILNRTTGVLGNGTITVANGGTVQNLTTLGGVGMTFYGNSTLTNIGTTSMGNSSYGITLGSNGGVFSLNTSSTTTDFATLTSSVVGGDGTNVISIGGNGTISLRGTSSGTNGFYGKWVVNAGAKLQVWDLGGLGIARASGISSVELAGGTLLAALGTGTTTTYSPGNAITVSASSTMLIDTQPNSFGNTTKSGIARGFGTLSIGNSTLSVGIAGSVVGPSTANVATEIGFTSATLYGNATFNIGNATTGNATTIGLQIVGAVTQNTPGYGITKTGGGLLELGGTNNYTGITSVTGGQLNINAFQTLTTSELNVQDGAKIVLSNNNQNWVVPKVFSGNGSITFAGNTGVTLTATGATFSPGGGGTSGTLTIATTGSGSSKAISISNSGAATSMNIDITGNGGIAGTDFDQLVLTTGSLTGGLSNTTLNLTTTGLNLADFTGGQRMTIVSATGIDFTSMLFKNDAALLAAGGKIFYLSGSIQVALPEPTSMAGLGLLTLAALRRRRRVT